MKNKDDLERCYHEMEVANRWGLLIALIVSCAIIAGFAALLGAM